MVRKLKGNTIIQETLIEKVENSVPREVGLVH